MSFVFAVEHGMNDILSIADETRPLLNSSVLNRNGLSDFPGFALTLEALREKEITTDPITGWRYQRTWEEAQMRSEREIRRLEELRRVNIEGYREDEE
jgi:hypothetical protein